jgi:hypothetical protein
MLRPNKVLLITQHVYPNTSMSHNNPDIHVGAEGCYRYGFSHDYIVYTLYSKELFKSNTKMLI